MFEYEEIFSKPTKNIHLRAPMFELSMDQQIESIVAMIIFLSET